MEAIIKYILEINQAIEQFDEAYYHSKMTHYASEIIADYNLSDTEFSEALERTYNVFNTLNLNTDHHIRKIYKTENHQIVYDFKLSPQAYALLLLNSSTHNPLIAKIQYELINKLLN